MPTYTFSLTCLLLASGCLRLIQTAEWTVDPQGSEAATGSLEAPLRTIQRAAQQAQPGDRVVIRSGSYRETVRPARSGTADRPITFSRTLLGLRWSSRRRLGRQDAVSVAESRFRGPEQRNPSRTPAYPPSDPHDRPQRALDGARGLGHRRDPQRQRPPHAQLHRARFHRRRHHRHRSTQSRAQQSHLRCRHRRHRLRRDPHRCRSPFA